MGPANLLRLQFPHLLPDAAVPPSVTIELTNVCNLACTYCTSPLVLRPQGMMSDATFGALLGQLREARVRRVRLVGNGEPTLHPAFPRLLQQLARTVPYVSLVTNGARLTDAVVDALVSAPARLVEVSVEGLDQESYAASRRRGDLLVLQKNLERLRMVRDERRSRMLLLVRLMLRPSQRKLEEELERAWRARADVLMKQYIVQRAELPKGDAYEPIQRPAGDYPRCTLPFKELDVLWTGEVTLCHFSASQIGEPGLVLGRVQDQSLLQLWMSPTMAGYRAAHRSRDESRMPICKGCAAV